MNNKKLLGLAIVLLSIFIALWTFSPTTGDKVETTTTAKEFTFAPGDYTTTEKTSEGDLPTNYIPVSGIKNVYKVIENGQITGYKEKTEKGYIDYDIDKPDFLTKKQGSDEIYEILGEDGNVYQYRKFNGKEWDIVDADGKTLFAIPKEYKREDISRDIYSYEKDGKTVYQQIIQFPDGSYGWKAVS